MEKIITAKQKIKFIRFDELKNSKFQPDSRLQNDATYRDMVKGFRNGSKLYLLPTVDKEYRIVDGHRRIKAMKEAGMKGCECYFLSEDEDQAGEIFTNINRGKHVTSLEYLEMIFKGGTPPPRVRSAVNRLLEKYDNDESVFNKVLDYGKKGANPITLADTHTRLEKFLGSYKVKSKKLMNWILKHNAIYSVKRVLEKGMPAFLVYQYIKNDKPIPSDKDIYRTLEESLKLTAAE